MSSVRDPRALAVVLVLIAAFAVTGTSSGAATGKLVVNSTVQHYTVSGTTIAAVRADLARHHVPSSDFYARTLWGLSYKASYVTTPTSCTLSAVTVSVTVTVTLPQLELSANTAPALRAHWNRFIAGTTKHEAGHKQIVLSYGNRLLAADKQVAVQASCAQLSAKLEQLREQLMREAVAANNAYDTRTQHGKTQGAVF